MLNINPYETEPESPTLSSVSGDRQLDNILSSGEIAAIFLGGTTPDSKVVTFGDVNVSADIDKLEKQLSVTTQTGVDVNNIMTEGIYLVDNNLPNGAQSGKLTVSKGVPDGIYQNIDTELGTFTRTYYSGAWSLWEPSYSKIELDRHQVEINANYALFQITDAIGSNIDNITEPGIYEVNTNLPAGYEPMSELTVRRFNNHTIDPKRVVQILYNTLTNAISERAAIDYTNPVWTPWKEIRIDNFYEYGIVQNMAVNDATWTPVTSVSKTGVAQGVYEFKVSITFSYSVTTRSAMFRHRLNGEAWKEIRLEVKDVTNREPFVYLFPVELLAGDVSFELEAMCEGSNDTLDIWYANLMIERKR